MTEIAFKPRPSQQKILEALLAASGPVRLGVSAVPGSGKTHILAYLASRLVQRISEEQEVLIVTLVNAAVDNFRRRVDNFVRQQGLLPGFNYRVCTLHSLAFDIVRQRPALAGISEETAVVDDRTAELILRDVVDSWLAKNPEVVQDYLLPTVDFRAISRQQLPELILTIAQSFIKRAKDLRYTYHHLEDAFRRRDEFLPLAQLGIDIYRDYQNRLARVGVDFDDLIRLAAQAIDLDPDFLYRLQEKWPIILEDEAQDSSTLQQEILERLAGPTGTWVRVGDPNQAIYETFTTADPQHLRDFLKRFEVTSMPMPESGRSTQSIINLANWLVEWTMTEHPLPEARSALRPPRIDPTPPGDPQPNPPDRPDAIHLRSEKFRSAQEVEAVVRSVKQWLANNHGKTVAILDARNKRGVDVANALRRAEVPYIELLSSTSATRSTAGVLGNVLKHLARPSDARQLATVFRVWKRFDWDREDLQQIFEWIEQALRECPRLEDYLWPEPGHDWLEQKLSQLREEYPDWANEWLDESLEVGQDAVLASVAEPATDQSETASPITLIERYLRQFKVRVRRWQEAAVLPIDQLILLLAQDLFDQPPDLALAHKFAVVLRQTAVNNPSFRLPEFVESLAEVARNQRRFLGFDKDATGFEPPVDKVTVSTMHRAKGLEWNRVYLLGMNNYSFPSGQPQDSYIAERWFIRDSLNLEAEALAQLTNLADGAEYVEGQATEAARLKIVRERLRLLYVGITRAKEELVITWNVGQQWSNQPDRQPAIPLVAIQTWQEQQMAGTE